VTFDIDANGILNVTAKDKDTGKDQKITISGSSSMDDEEVDRLKKEAEKFADQDKEKKEAVQTRNDLDSLVYQCEKQLTDLGDKATDELKKMTDDMLAEAKKVLDDQSSTTSAIKEAKEKLEKGFEELAKLAAQAGGGATDPAAAAAAAAAQSQSSGDNKSKEDDIVDADFEVVDDENDEKEKS
jgi:molecular chaperone DnaK